MTAEDRKSSSTMTLLSPHQKHTSVCTFLTSCCIASLRIEICLHCTCNMLENKCTVPQAYGERENMDHMLVWGWCCTAKHVANTCARSPLSSFIILRTGGNRQSSFASGCLASRRASGFTTACVPLPQLFFLYILKIQPQNGRGLDKFLEFKNSDQYWTTVCMDYKPLFCSTTWVCGVSLFQMLQLFLFF